MAALVFIDSAWNQWEVLDAHFADKAELADITHRHPSARFTAVGETPPDTRQAFDLVLGSLNGIPVESARTALTQLAVQVAGDGLLLIDVEDDTTLGVGDILAVLEENEFRWGASFAPEELSAPDGKHAPDASSPGSLAVRAPAHEAHRGVRYVVGGRGTSHEECTPQIRGRVAFGASTFDEPAVGQSPRDRRRLRMVRVALHDRLAALADAIVNRWGAEPMKRVLSGIDIAIGRSPRRRAASGQRPALFFLPDLPTPPWIEPHDHAMLADLVRQLTSDAKAMRGELDALSEGEAHFLAYLDGDYMAAKFADLRDNWQSVELLAQGLVPDAIGQRCPSTAAVMRRIAPDISGDVILSRLKPGVSLLPHYDDNNYKLTVHLGLHIPDDCGIRVGGEARTWREGECLIFSDAYLHEAWNRGATARDILLLDVWHPDITAPERDAIRQLRVVLDAACHPSVFDNF